MQSDGPLSPDQKKLIHRHQIYILGTETIQNELMRDLFRYELQCYPGLSTDVHAFPVSSTLHGGRRLLLIDCHNRDMDYYVQSYDLKERIIPYFKLVAFYNLSEAWGGERVAIDEGITGFFYDTDSVKTLCEGIFTLFTEGLWIPRGGLFEPIEGGSDGTARDLDQMKAMGFGMQLTKREKEILKLLRTGYSNEAISEHYSIGVSTVKTHLYNVYKKIDVSNRSAATAWALRFIKD